jgi:GTP-binding protein YchF
VKIVITGFSNSGKTTIFNALTGLNLPTTTYPTLISTDIKPHIGVVEVPDTRIDKLSSIYKPRKTTHATIEYIDYLGITSGDVAQNSKIFNLIRDVDAIVHVVRVFEDESVMHPLGSIDPVRDVKAFETELILGDLEFVEKRLERIELSAKKGMKHDESDKPLLFKCKKALEDEIPLRNISFTDEEGSIMLSYQFLSTIPEIVVLNIGEKDINTEKIKKLQNEIENYFKEKNQSAIPEASGRPVIALCGKLEMEIAQLPQDEAKIFLDDLGIEEQATNKLCRISYEALDLISFFTVIRDEVRAWTIKKGTEALKAAGKVHSDMERGFIRAEVIGFDDFVSSGEDMVKAKEKGLVRLEGKNYIVKDGDIINFKFNV